MEKFSYVIYKADGVSNSTLFIPHLQEPDFSVRLVWTRDFLQAFGGKKYSKLFISAERFLKIVFLSLNTNKWTITLLQIFYITYCCAWRATLKVNALAVSYSQCVRLHFLIVFNYNSVPPGYSSFTDNKIPKVKTLHIFISQDFKINRIWG